MDISLDISVSHCIPGFQNKTAQQASSSSIYDVCNIQWPVRKIRFIPTIDLTADDTKYVIRD